MFMRREFFTYLYELMKVNPKIVALTGDLGYVGFDRIRSEFPDRFINCGAAEFAMMGMACGLALEGKIPVVYSIHPLLLYRPFEVIRTYINHESIPVIMIGSGRGNDYEHDGFSHFAGDDFQFMIPFNNIQSYWPESTKQMRQFLDEAISKGKPTYINLKR